MEAAGGAGGREGGLLRCAWPPRLGHGSFGEQACARLPAWVAGTREGWLKVCQPGCPPACTPPRPLLYRPRLPPCTMHPSTHPPARPPTRACAGETYRGRWHESDVAVKCLNPLMVRCLRYRTASVLDGRGAGCEGCLQQGRVPTRALQQGTSTPPLLLPLPPATTGACPLPPCLCADRRDVQQPPGVGGLCTGRQPDGQVRYGTGGTPLVPPLAGCG